jgi:hypothetical protein
MPPTHCPPIPMVVGGSFFRTEPVGSPAHAPKNPNAPAVKRGAEEEWGRGKA